MVFQKQIDLELLCKLSSNTLKLELILNLDVHKSKEQTSEAYDGKSSFSKGDVKQAKETRENP